MGHNNKYAFSLFELLITIAAIIIFFTLTIPKLSFVNKFVLQNEVDKLFTIFSFLKQRSITSNTQQHLFFDLNKNCYFYQLNDYSNKGQILRDGNMVTSSEEAKSIIHKLPKAITFGYLPSSLGPPSNPTKKISRAITFKKNANTNQYKVTFLSDGKILPGTVFFIDINNQDMMALTCPISQVSCIRKYKYQNGKWICLK